MDVNCPRCGQPLTKTFYQGKIAFYCQQGHGEAVSLSVVRALCGQPTFANMLWRKALDASENGGVPCPLCRLPMSVIRLPVKGVELELDICCRCQELWFDPTELEELPKPPPPPKAPQMPQRAKEILAIHAVNEMRKNEPRPEGLCHVAGIFDSPGEVGGVESFSRPWCTWALVALSVAIYWTTYDNAKVAVYEWGLIPSECLRKGGFTFFTSMFLHENFFHLFSNMFALLIFGNNVEDVLGVSTYLASVLGSGLVANLLHVIVFHNSKIPLVGASSFISGIMATYAVFFPTVTVSFYTRIGWFRIPRWVRLPVWCAFGLWLFFDLVTSIILMDEAGVGTAYTAHVGGAVFGLVVGFLLRHKLKERMDAISEL
jgi:membrane associated rhomboid family serine protease